MLALSPAFPTDAPRFIEYLYINASEGTASGGHAAIKFGDEVFHFQHVPPGLIRAIRDDFGWFRRQYGGIENRTIHLHRIEVSGETYEILRDAFARRLLIQDEQFERFKAMGRDRRLLELFRGRNPHDNDGYSVEARPLELKGLGLFLQDGWNAALPDEAEPQYWADATLVGLRKRMEARDGPHFLRVKSDEIRARLQALELMDFDPKSSFLSEDHFLPAAYSFADRYADLLTGLAALQILERGLPLRTDILFTPSYPEFKLSTAELAKLADFKRQLEVGLLRLIESQRPDWGFPLLVGMARLIALDASIASGRLAVLDVLQEPAEPVKDSFGGMVRQTLFDEARRNFEIGKALLVDEDSLDERVYSRFEQAASLFLEFRNAMQQARQVRPFAGAGTPRKPAVVEPIRPAMTEARLTAELGKLKAQYEAYEARLTDRYRYDLMTRNCVSEIFRTIDAALAGQSAQRGAIAEPSADEVESRVRAESVRRLGGYVDHRSLNFVPFVSFQTVGETYRVSETLELPSYRHQHLNQAYTQENPLLVDLRESNVLSSTLYRWHGRDAAFVFFTDEPMWSRPLAGSVNAVVALGQGAAGLLTLPWDSGENLHQGIKGLLISLPELLFFNIRKGSYPDLPLASPLDRP